jgi:hypothetical protein
VVDDWKIEVRQQHRALITRPIYVVYIQSLYLAISSDSCPLEFLLSPFDVKKWNENGEECDATFGFQCRRFCVCNGCRFVCDTFVSNSFSVSELLHSDFLFLRRQRRTQKFFPFFNQRLAQIGARHRSTGARTTGRTTRRANFQKVNNKILIEGTERTMSRKQNKKTKKSNKKERKETRRIFREKF